jgi:hypothetical protein
LSRRSSADCKSPVVWENEVQTRAVDSRE